MARIAYYWNTKKEVTHFLDENNFSYSCDKDKLIMFDGLISISCIPAEDNSRQPQCVHDTYDNPNDDPKKFFNKFKRKFGRKLEEVMDLMDQHFKQGKYADDDPSK